MAHDYRRERTPETQAAVDRFAPVVAIIKARGAELRAVPGVFNVRPGFALLDGEHTSEPAIIALIDPRQEKRAASVPLPASIDGVRVQARLATAQEIIDGVVPLTAWQGLRLEAAPHIGYKPPDPAVVSLTPQNVHGITCHIGPDSGWTTLQPFLEGTTSHLTVAMYEFYARHIIDTVTTLGADTEATMNMILQVDSNDLDTPGALEESWGERVSVTPASVSGPHRVFNNSYHTKVAVRDSTAFWLSSGNWSPASQPVIAPGSEQTLYRKGNREWHVIVEHEGLSRIYERFIEHDIRQAADAGAQEAERMLPDLLVPIEAFMEAEAVVLQDHPFRAKRFADGGAPVRVRPLMSPDNYATEILALIQSAQRSLFLQFSYIRQPSTEVFDDIITAIAEKMNGGIDVRVLVDRGNQKAEHTDLLLGPRRWKREMFRLQTSRVHNKGILVDGEIAVVGSNNWSSDGTQYNRDSSLVFHSPAIAEYFTEVFLFDWNNLSRPAGAAPEIEPIVAPDSGPTPLGMVRIPWRAWFDE